MNALLIALFLLGLTLLVYVYAGYPLLLRLLVAIRGPKLVKKAPITPSMSVIIAAQNEESVIKERIEDLFGTDYPRDAMEIIIGSDGSTDATNEIVGGLSKKYGQAVRLVACPTKRGRALVHNDAVSAARGEILVFTDADTRFDPKFLAMVASNFADETVGCVSGVLTYQNTQNTSVSMGLGLYWRIERSVRQLESLLGVYCFSSGACMAMRRSTYRPLEASEDIDTAGPLDVISAGFRVVNEPDAVAYDEVPATIGGEIRSRIRLILQSMSGRWRRKELLNPFRHPKYSWAIFSHKILRWMTPYFLIVVFLANLVLLNTGHPIWIALMAGQLAFYFAGFLGYLLEQRGTRVKPFSIVFTFSLVNIGFLLGTWGFLRGHHMATYDSQK